MRLGLKFGLRVCRRKTCDFQPQAKKGQGLRVFRRKDVEFGDVRRRPSFRLSLRSSDCQLCNTGMKSGPSDMMLLSASCVMSACLCRTATAPCDGRSPAKSRVSHVVMAKVFSACLWRSIHFAPSQQLSYHQTSSCDG